MGSSGFEELFVRVADVALAGCIAWAGLVLIAAVVEARSGGHFAWTRRVGCPAALRTALIAGITAAGIAVPPAHAEGVPDSPNRSLDGLAVPDRPSDLATDLPVPRQHPPAAVSSWITVRPGDSLWSLVRQRSQPGASDASVAAAVRGVFARNRAVIGPDPDRIRPGQRLSITSTNHSARITYSEDL